MNGFLPIKSAFFFVLLLVPVSTVGQVVETGDLVRKETVAKHMGMREGEIKEYRHELEWTAERDTASIRRTWRTNREYLGSTEKNGRSLFVTDVTIDDVNIDTTVRRSTLGDTLAWIGDRPRDHLIVYVNDRNRVYQFVERELKWPEQQSEIADKYTDSSQFSARPPWYVLPPYTGHCRNEGGIVAEQCLLDEGPTRGGRPTWQFQYAGDVEDTGSQPTVRVFNLAFQTGQSVDRYFQRGTGLRKQRTQAGWTETVELVGTREKKRESPESETTSNTVPAIPDLPEINSPFSPASPNQPNELPDMKQPNQLNTPNNQDSN